MVPREDHARGDDCPYPMVARWNQARRRVLGERFDQLLVGNPESRLWDLRPSNSRSRLLEILKSAVGSGRRENLTDLGNGRHGKVPLRGALRHDLNIYIWLYSRIVIGGGAAGVRNLPQQPTAVPAFTFFSCALTPCID